MKKIFLIAVTVILVGCAKPMPSKGQQMNFTGGDALAWRVCQGWGYAGARAINIMPVSKCVDWSVVAGVCYVGQQKQQYQCTTMGNPQ